MLRRRISISIYEILNYGPVAQRQEQWAFNPLVEGSNPSRPTITMRFWFSD